MKRIQWTQIENRILSFAIQCSIHKPTCQSPDDKLVLASAGSAIQYHTAILPVLVTLSDEIRHILL